MPECVIEFGGWNDTDIPFRIGYSLYFYGEGLAPGRVVETALVWIDPAEGDTQEEKNAILASAVDAAWAEIAGVAIDEDLSTAQNRRALVEKLARRRRKAVTQISTTDGRLVRGGGRKRRKKKR